MKYLKVLWPIVLFSVVIYICANEWNTNPAASTDAGGVIVYCFITYCVFLPACSLISGLWYGYIFKGKYKWIIWSVGLIPGIILMILCGDEFSPALLVFEAPPVVAAFIGQMVGNMIWKAREKRRDKF